VEEGGLLACGARHEERERRSYRRWQRDHRRKWRSGILAESGRDGNSYGNSRTDCFYEKQLRLPQHRDMVEHVGIACVTVTQSAERRAGRTVRPGIYQDRVAQRLPVSLVSHAHAKREAVTSLHPSKKFRKLRVAIRCSLSPSPRPPIASSRPRHREFESLRSTGGTPRE
jgi:hypothetical protein